MKKLIFAIAFITLFITYANLYGADRHLNFDCENWTGDRSTTPDYPFSSGYDTYCNYHTDTTEIVESYNGWTPKSGSWFYLRNDSSVPLDPPVDGITAGRVNDNGNIGFNGSSCSNNSLEMQNDITTGEIFIRFWARMEGFDEDIGGRCKWIRLYSDDTSSAGTTFMHLSTGEQNPRMYFYNSAEGYWLGETSGGLPNAYDGNWHQFSFYVNYNTGDIMGWYFENGGIETTDNAIKKWNQADGQTPGDGMIGNASRPNFFLIQANFSAAQPSQITYHAIDDLEIWDGMPDAVGTSDITPPSPPTGLTIN